jgi:hypothetical protein
MVQSPGERGVLRRGARHRHCEPKAKQSTSRHNACKGIASPSAGKKISHSSPSLRGGNAAEVIHQHARRQLADCFTLLRSVRNDDRRAIHFIPPDPPKAGVSCEIKCACPLIVIARRRSRRSIPPESTAPVVGLLHPLRGFAMTIKRGSPHPNRSAPRQCRTRNNAARVQNEATFLEIPANHVSASPRTPTIQVRQR